MKLTKRQMYLLTYAGPKHSFIRVSAYGTPDIIRAYVSYRDASCRNPSKRELDVMVRAGWMRLRHDKDSCITNTKTGEKKYGHRAVLTAAGERALAIALTPARLPYTEAVKRRPRGACYCDLTDEDCYAKGHWKPLPVGEPSLGCDCKTHCGIPGCDGPGRY